MNANQTDASIKRVEADAESRIVVNMTATGDKPVKVRGGFSFFFVQRILKVDTCVAGRRASS